MSEQRSNNSTLTEIERLLNDRQPDGYSESSRDASRQVSESPLSSATSPDLLNTAFAEETDDSASHAGNVSSQQSQTTKDASSAIYCLIDTITIAQEHRAIDVPVPTTPTMKLTGAMPKTPATKSTGTLSRTPTMVDAGTMPMTPVTKSTGTMPMTPATKSTGTMPTTPATKSTGTMPKTPTTIDLVSPTKEK